MPRGGLTDATHLSFQVLRGAFGGTDVTSEPAQALAQRALRIPPVGSGDLDEREERVPELRLRRGFPAPTTARIHRGDETAGITQGLSLQTDSRGDHGEVDA
ncbi:hypothetical protein RS82_02468 [Microbacterium trichothecenolyticum]|uniref:Uncharacterized protein n=1 Tax=Microbacterium trichothecenolyticum TaxID=69370 RepID=A0A0M2H686_MICTR|nr:hypothetical protein RS82_02468 [Microbacterium trichothecenolyticum]